VENIIGRGTGEAWSQTGFEMKASLHRLNPAGILTLDAVSDLAAFFESVPSISHSVALGHRWGRRLDTVSDISKFLPKIHPITVSYAARYTDFSSAFSGFA
jgi:hypothetical protein